MTPAMQQWIVVAVVAVAAVYLSARAWRSWRAATVRKQPGCGCDHC